MAYKGQIIGDRYKCPCGHDTLIGRSAQVCEDGCEMWLECESCGYDPSPNDHVETVWGWQDEWLFAAKEVWMEGIKAHEKTIARGIKESMKVDW